MKRAVKVGIAAAIAVPLVAIAAIAMLLRAPGPRESRETVERDIARLTTERDSMRTLVGDAGARSALLARRPEGDVLIALPTAFVESLVHDIVTGWFSDVELNLRGLVFHKAGDVRAPMGLLGRQRIGSYDMDITFDEVRGHLRAGAPALEFGRDEIKVALPVRVVDGTVSAMIAIVWESRGLADAICGDLAARQAVNGTVREMDHIAIGRLVLGARDGTVVVDPEFPDLAIRLFVDPSPESVAELERVLGRTGGLCGIAVDKFKAGDLIQARVARGFLVRIPQKFFRPVRLPITVERSVPHAGGSLSLAVTPHGLVVTPAAAWLAADVRIGSRR